MAVSIVLAGALLGAAVGGYLGDRFGRKPLQIANATVFGYLRSADRTGEHNCAVSARLVHGRLRSRRTFHDHPPLYC